MESEWPPVPPAASAPAFEAPPVWDSPDVSVIDAGYDEPFSSDVAMPAQPVDTEMLDDDAFFASLRDAVRDDAPLGSLDGSSGSFFDEPEAEPSSRRFRRR
jgi:hypothetical protein